VNYGQPTVFNVKESNGITLFIKPTGISCILSEGDVIAHLFLALFTRQCNIIGFFRCSQDSVITLDFSGIQKTV
jgi:hypothetical protein